MCAIGKLTLFLFIYWGLVRCHIHEARSLCRSPAWGQTATRRVLCFERLRGHPHHPHHRALVHLHFGAVEGLLMLSRLGGEAER